MNIWVGDAEIFGEDVRHHGVVVLAGVDDDVFYVRLGGEGLSDRTQLDELRPGPDDAEYLHELVSFPDCRSRLRIRPSHVVSCAGDRRRPDLAALAGAVKVSSCAAAQAPNSGP